MYLLFCHLGCLADTAAAAGDAGGDTAAAGDAGGDARSQVKDAEYKDFNFLDCCHPMKK